MSQSGGYALGMSEEQTVYRHAIEGLYGRALADKITPELKDKLRAVGLDLDAKIEKGIPRAVYAKALKVTVKHLHPGVDETEGYRQLGMSMIAGLERTLIGKALVSMWPIFGPNRVLSRMQESFSTVNNYLKTELKSEAKNHHVIVMNELNGNPGYFRGIIQAALTKAGCKNLQVEAFDLKGAGGSYRVRWD